MSLSDLEEYHNKLVGLSRNCCNIRNTLDHFSLDDLVHRGARAKVTTSRRGLRGKVSHNSSFVTKTLYDPDNTLTKVSWSRTLVLDLKILFNFRENRGGCLRTSRTASVPMYHIRWISTKDGITYVQINQNHILFQTWIQFRSLPFLFSTSRGQAHLRD